MKHFKREAILMIAVPVIVVVVGLLALLFS